MSNAKRTRRRLGDIVSIHLGDGTFGFGRVLREPLIAFYDFRSAEIPSIGDIVNHRIAFVVFVMNKAVTEGIWPVLGNLPLDNALLVEPLFFKHDKISSKFTIYQDSTGKEKPATRDECEELESAAVWSPEHAVDRLNDHFRGLPNKWVESLRRPLQKE